MVKFTPTQETSSQVFINNFIGMVADKMCKDGKISKKEIKRYSIIYFNFYIQQGLENVPFAHVLENAWYETKYGIKRDSNTQSLIDDFIGSVEYKGCDTQEELMEHSELFHGYCKRTLKSITPTTNLFFWACMEFLFTKEQKIKGISDEEIKEKILTKSKEFRNFIPKT